MPLITENNFHHPDKRHFRAYRPGDDFYQMLIDAHRDLDEQNSARLNARLVLILSNQVGDLSILEQVIGEARRGLETREPETEGAQR